MPAEQQYVLELLKQMFSHLGSFKLSSAHYSIARDAPIALRMRNIRVYKQIGVGLAESLARVESAMEGLPLALLTLLIMGFANAVLKHTSLKRGK